jgi:hypothetical protein
LFSLAPEKAIRKTSLDVRDILLKSVQILAYVADYILGRYERTVKEAYIKLKKAAEQMGLAFSQASKAIPVASHGGL